MSVEESSNNRGKDQRMDNEPQMFQHDEKAKKRRNFFVKLAWLVFQSVIGIYVISYWHQWLVLIFYLCLIVTGFIFQVVTFLRIERPEKAL